MPNVRTPRAPVRVEVERVKASRFVADLAPAANEAMALSVVDAARARWPDATHHCWAFRLADGTQRMSDDGEPRDTAGAPILRHLAGAQLQDVACVVTRWFGGTKLGRGGLIRAYGDATAAAIAAASIVTRPVLVEFVVTHPYDLSAAVQGVLAAHDATVIAADYGVEVVLEVALVAESRDAFTRQLADDTSGRVRAVPRGGTA